MLFPTLPKPATEMPMPKEQRFETTIASLPDHDQLVAEIYCDGLFFALVSQERGNGLFDIETPGRNLTEGEVTRKVDLNLFLIAAREARECLAGDKT